MSNRRMDILTNEFNTTIRINTLQLHINRIQLHIKHKIILNHRNLTPKSIYYMILLILGSKSRQNKSVMIEIRKEVIFAERHWTRESLREIYEVKTFCMLMCVQVTMMYRCMCICVHVYKPELYIWDLQILIYVKNKLQ